MPRPPRSLNIGAGLGPNQRRNFMNAAQQGQGAQFLGQHPGIANRVQAGSPQEARMQALIGGQGVQPRSPSMGPFPQAPNMAQNFPGMQPQPRPSYQPMPQQNPSPQFNPQQSGGMSGALGGMSGGNMYQQPQEGTLAGQYGGGNIQSPYGGGGNMANQGGQQPSSWDQRLMGMGMPVNRGGMGGGQFSPQMNQILQARMGGMSGLMSGGNPNVRPNQAPGITQGLPGGGGFSQVSRPSQVNSFGGEGGMLGGARGNPMMGTQFSNPQLY